MSTARLAFDDDGSVLVDYGDDRRRGFGSMVSAADGRCVTSWWWLLQLKNNDVGVVGICWFAVNSCKLW